jgi:hypothetical protein
MVPAAEPQNRRSTHRLFTACEALKDHSVGIGGITEIRGLRTEFR